MMSLTGVFYSIGKKTEETQADVSVHSILTDVAPHTETVALPELQSCRAPVACKEFTSTPDKYSHCHPLTCQKLTEIDFPCS